MTHGARLVGLAVTVVAALAVLAPFSGCSSTSPTLASPDAAGDAGADVTADAGDAFGCGDLMTCDGRTQICEHTSGGVPPGVDMYRCLLNPTECRDDPSCACLTTALRNAGAVACAASGSGLVVQIAVP